MSVGGEKSFDNSESLNSNPMLSKSRNKDRKMMIRC